MHTPHRRATTITGTMLKMRVAAQGLARVAVALVSPRGRLPVSARSVARGAVVPLGVVSAASFLWITGTREHSGLTDCHKGVYRTVSRGCSLWITPTPAGPT